MPADLKNQYITIGNLAARAGVSKTTVSMVLNRRNGARIAEATRRRIERLARKVGYRPNPLARHLRACRQGVLAYCVADYSQLHGKDVIQRLLGIQAAVQTERYQVVLIGVHETRRGNGVWNLEPALAHLRPDGVITELRPVAKRFIAWLDQARMPYFMIEPRCDRVRRRVSLNFVLAGRTAVAALLALGHRRIGCVAGVPGMADGRLIGYGEALRKAGIAEQWIEFGYFDYARARQAAMKLLTRHPGLTAIFGISDVMAIAAIHAARHTGRRVPQDLSVIGFDDIDAAAWSDPPLTTLGFPDYKIGEYAGNMLLRSLALHDADLRPKTFVPVMVRRRSIARCRSHKNG